MPDGVVSVPSWLLSEMDMKGEPCTLPLIEPQIPGVHVAIASSLGAAAAAPAMMCSWNYVDIHMDAVLQGRRDEICRSTRRDQ